MVGEDGATSSHGRVDRVPDKQLQLGEDRNFLLVQSAWNRALEALAERVNKPSFESFIKTARPLSVDGSTVRIGTTSAFGRQLLQSRHLAFILEMLESELGFKVDLQLELVKDDQPTIMSDRLPKKPKPKEDEEPISQPLNRHYTFENFVVGTNNRLAHACAEAIAECPGKTYNPLFIYGGPGLGKTHLMQAVGHYVGEQHPSLRVAYVSGETFTYHYISALREHRSADFRRKYRSMDVWLVDDIQFLAGKERTEEEFFHTYNAIQDLGKQIVLTSDRAPKDLELDERLLSRFEMGMIADISPPDFETRVAILQTKACTEDMPAFSDEVIVYIAKLITRDIRELQGALIKLHAYASLMKTSVTRGLAEEVLAKYFGEGAAAVVDTQHVQKEVAKRFNIELSELKGKCRSQDIVTPRQVAMYLGRELTGLSLPALGKAFGRDHSTVLHACRKIEEKIARDKAFAALITELSRKIAGA